MKKCKPNSWDQICGCSWADMSCPNSRELQSAQDSLRNPKPSFKFGDPVINIYASEINPQRNSFFVKKVIRKGVMNRGTWAECTDKKGKFWQVEWEAIRAPNENP